MQRKPKVMIADDEERLRITLGRMLGNRGLDVTTLGSGEEAIETLTRDSFDVVLLDLRMPGMSGLETLARIKQVDPGVEVILLTGHASVDAATEAMKLGSYDYLLKPCSVEDIILRIESACERRRETGKIRRNQDVNQTG